ncbi:MAG: class II fructose-bisphosphate aldolase [Candidatus Omnitrophica bacterium]|nr:class II fructose-bisphosphate aldolase [Candidatus Omnitrophota bacterium]
MVLTGKNNIGVYFKAAYEAKIVIPALNVPHVPMMSAIADTLAEYDAFGLIEVALLEIVKFKSQSWAVIAAEYERVADPRYTSLHADHTPAIDEDGLPVDWKAVFQEVLSLGYKSLMIDGSRLPFYENIKITSEVVKMAHPKDVFVEAELGAVSGHEEGPAIPYAELFAGKKGFTNPEEAGEFVKKTGVDWLSVAIGNVHGPIAAAVRNQPKVEAMLDIAHLKKIKAAAGIPLVLHGGSGVKQSDVDQAILNGITKINIGAVLRKAYEFALEGEGGNIAAGQAAVRDAMQNLICNLFHIEGSATRLRQLAGNQS